MCMDVELHDLMIFTVVVSARVDFLKSCGCVLIVDCHERLRL